MASPQSSPSAANLNLGIPEGRCSAGWGADIQYCLMYGVHCTQGDELYLGIS